MKLSHHENTKKLHLKHLQYSKFSIMNVTGNINDDWEKIQGCYYI